MGGDAARCTGVPRPAGGQVGGAVAGFPATEQADESAVCRRIDTGCPSRKHFERYTQELWRKPIGLITLYYA
jgi:hypothetical protein